MLENVNTYKRLQEDYKEYIELWIHEIKIPIATSKLIIENNKNEITKSIDEELDEIENIQNKHCFMLEVIPLTKIMLLQNQICKK